MAELLEERGRLTDPQGMAEALGVLVRRTGLRQKELAERAGVSRNALSLYIRGQAEPTWARLAAIVAVLAEELDVTPHEVIAELYDFAATGYMGRLLVQANARRAG